MVHANMGANQVALRSVLLLLTVSVGFALDVKPIDPGLQLRLSQAGLDYVGNVAVEMLAAEMKTQHLPDQRGTVRLKVGKVEYVMSHMVIRSFNRPSSHVIVDTDKGFTWSTSGTSASMHGNWRYKYL